MTHLQIEVVTESQLGTATRNPLLRTKSARYPYEGTNPWPPQHRTPFTCPDCQEHTFETEAEILSEQDFAGAECTNCGHMLMEDEIAHEMESIPTVVVLDTVANAGQL
jgi:transcription elongation factor Elf1